MSNLWYTVKLIIILSFSVCMLWACSESDTENGSDSSSDISSSIPVDNGQYIGEASAKSIALEHAGIAEQDAVFIKTNLDRDDGRVVYDVEFYSGNTEYEYEIDATTGQIREYDRDTEYYPPSPDQYIGDTQAKAIALEHAKISEQEAEFTKVRLDRDDGIVVYDISFFSGNAEYDYEIDAVTGQIRDVDVDIRYYPPSDQYISETQAKTIAFEHAGISEQQANFIEVHLDYDNRRVVYDIEFYSGTVEYEYEIDALTGVIVESEIDFD